ncbi:WD40-repeat-containing domain protein [Butyriboletus roseoflavus]|nr:WD40-repeat-containing domain protein [Butyriboletus roseoflavus]
MSSTNTDPTIVLDTGSSDWVCGVAFHPDGIHLLGGSDDGFRKWRLADGQEVGKQTGVRLPRVISVSRDRVVGGSWNGATVWDAELREKIIQVEDTNLRAFGGSRAERDSLAHSSMTEKLPESNFHQMASILPLLAGGIPFASLTLTTATRSSISRTTTPSSTHTITPLAWSNDGQHIFAVCGRLKSIALATNGKFFATNAGPTISFLDTSTLTRIGLVIKDSGTIFSIALSQDCNYLATGREDGKIAVRELGHILPELYGSFHPSTPEERERDEQPSTLGSHNNERTDSTVEQPGKSNPVVSAAHIEDVSGDLLEADVSLSSAAPEFDYESLSSASSVHLHEEEAPPFGTFNAVPQSLDVPSYSLPSRHRSRGK